MERVVAQKWRPTLGLIVFAVLTTVLLLPLVGLFFFRLYENQLIRQTEAELVAQSAVLAAVMAKEVEAFPNLRLGIPAPPSTSADPDEPFDPIEPSLDLAADDMLGRRPDAIVALAPPAPEFVTIGERLQEVALRAQRVTLAGFRVLDPNGVVIAGRGEVGESLAHIEEVAAAINGRYRSVLRTRVPNRPPPPLYSITRGTGVLVFTAMPVVVAGKVAGVIYGSRTPANIIKHIFAERRKFLLAGLTMVLVTLAIGFVFWRAITRPINMLVAKTAEIGQGKREALRPMRHHGTREIALLSQSFIEMAERLHQRSDYIVTFAAHVSHELKTPLTSIKGAAELLRDAADGMSPAERQRFLDNIISDTTRLTTMLQRLRELAAAENLQIKGVTTPAAALTKLVHSLPGVRVESAGALDAKVAISEENLGIVLSHLADNAARHKARTLRVEVARDGAELRIELRDDGEGVSEKNRDKIFDAFFTTRRESGGTGMGLGIVRAMLGAHGGSIRLLDGAGGATFEIRLPAA